jgi:hypothetical protein
MRTARKCSLSAIVPCVREYLENTESTIRRFAEDCTIYRKTLSNNDVEIFQIDLNKLGEWAFEMR